jgi:hypothetical protein
MQVDFSSSALNRQVIGITFHSQKLIINKKKKKKFKEQWQKTKNVEGAINNKTFHKE